MPIKFRCQHCDQLMSIATRKAGTITVCPRCAHDTLVPEQQPELQEQEQVQSEIPVSESDDDDNRNDQERIEQPIETSSLHLASVSGEEEEDELDFEIKRANTEFEELDMTPMVDVTFLLLIFFMVTAAFTMQRSFEVPTPKTDQSSSQARTLDDFADDPNFVIVRIDEFNTFHILVSSWDEERECPSEQDLLVNLREASRGEADNRANKLLVMAHGDAVHEKVVMAMDAGTAVGMEDVKLVTVEDDSL